MRTYTYNDIQHFLNVPSLENQSLRYITKILNVIISCSELLEHTKIRFQPLSNRYVSLGLEIVSVISFNSLIMLCYYCMLTVVSEKSNMKILQSEVLANYQENNI